MQMHQPVERRTQGSHKTQVDDLIFFLQHYAVFLQVPGVFSIFRPTFL